MCVRHLYEMTLSISHKNYLIKDLHFHERTWNSYALQFQPLNQMILS